MPEKHLATLYADRVIEAQTLGLITHEREALADPTRPRHLPVSRQRDLTSAGRPSA
jgi:hypothetical protein